MKKHLAILLAVVMLAAGIAALTACGDKKPAEAPSQTESAAPSAADADTAAADGDTTAADGDAALPSESEAAPGAAVEYTPIDVGGVAPVIEENGITNNDLAMAYDGKVYIPGVTTVGDLVDDGWELVSTSLEIDGQMDPGTGYTVIFKKDDARIEGATLHTPESLAVRDAVCCGFQIAIGKDYGKAFTLPYGITADMSVEQMVAQLTANGWTMKEDTYGVNADTSVHKEVDFNIHMYQEAPYSVFFGVYSFALD